MAQKRSANTVSQTSWLQIAAVRATRVHFLYIAAYMVTIILFDSWNLVPHEAVSQRWTAAGIMLIANTALWYTARMKFASDKIYSAIILTLVAADIIFASLNVFWQRGMASKSVALYAIPLITAAATRSRSAVLAAGSLCVAGYSMAAVRYFNLHYGEGFRVELYGEVLFYTATFFVIILLLFIIIRPSNKV